MWWNQNSYMGVVCNCREKVGCLTIFILPPVGRKGEKSHEKVISSFRGFCSRRFDWLRRKALLCRVELFIRNSSDARLGIYPVACVQRLG